MNIEKQLKKLCKDEKLILNSFPACTKHCPALIIRNEQKKEDLELLKRLNKENSKLYNQIQLLKADRTQNKADREQKNEQGIQTYSEEIKRLKNALNELQKDNDQLRKNIVEISKNKKFTKRQHKYNAIPTFVDGIRFASRKESRRYIQLKAMKRAKVIKDFWLQPKFVLSNGVKKITYNADFKVLYPNGKIEIEDVKGKKTPVYNLKKSLMKNCYGIDIKEI